MNKPLVTLLTIFISLTGFFVISVFAQKEKMIGVGKSGNFHINSSLYVDGVLLKAGMYQVKALIVNDEHFITFRKVEMGYRDNMGNQKIGDEVTRVKCSVELVIAQNKNAKILARSNAENKWEAIEIWFRNGKVKYKLPTN